MGPIGRIQTILKEFVPDLVVDEKWGARSQAALEKVLRPATPEVSTPAPDNAEKVDARSETAIATLHRNVQPIARALVRTATQAGIQIKVTSGTRTYAEQDKLFAQGGVTKARGGQSNHNFGLAFDITIFDGNQPVWESPKYKTIGQLGKSLGLEWGGDWKSIVDEPHFQLRPKWAEGMSEGQMLAELRRRHDNGIDAFT
jgi:peptidoglycan L-alanyl-D-glutamate endopeptidase CwlK